MAKMCRVKLGVRGRRTGGLVLCLGTHRKLTTAMARATIVLACEPAVELALVDHTHMMT